MIQATRPGTDGGMDNLTRFLEYAGPFEQTYVDDDWSRLRPFFADDAVYEVQSDSFGCVLRGPDAILRGIRKSVDGFDRRFDVRRIDVTAGPEVDGDELRIDWSVTYEKEGVTPFVLIGRSRARYRDGKLVELVDSYDPSVTLAAVAWQRANGLSFDPSYV